MDGKNADDVNRMAEQAAQNIQGMAAQAKRAVEGASAAAQQAQDAFADARDTAWTVAQRARRQASELAEDVYTRGGRAVEVVRGQVEEQPMVAVAAAGVLGFILGYMLSRRR